MRLWHNSLIDVLPRLQLLGQWRELNSILKLRNKHILINFVYEYPPIDLYCYTINVIKEMRRRAYILNIENFEKYFLEYNVVYDENYIPFRLKMNDTYLKICIANLYEKYLCGGITHAEWNVIYLSHKTVIDKINF